MALTKPKISNLSTDMVAFSDPLTVLHAGATSANVDVGFLFNRANGLVSNVALYWSESTQSFTYAFTNNTGITSTNVAATSFASMTADKVYTNGLFWAANSQPLTGAVNTYTSVVGNTNPSIYLGTILANTSPTLIDTLPITGNSSVRWATTSKDNVNSRYRVTTVDSLNDGTSVFYTEYGTIKSNNSFNVATFTSNISSGNINLWAVGDSSSISVSFQRTVVGTASPTGYINNFGPPGTMAGTIGVISTSNASPAISTTTGALQIPFGGASIGGNLYVGGNAYVGSNRIETSVPHPFMLMGAA